MKLLKENPDNVYHDNEKVASVYNSDAVSFYYQPNAYLIYSPNNTHAEIYAAMRNVLTLLRKKKKDEAVEYLKNKKIFYKKLGEGNNISKFLKDVSMKNSKTVNFEVCFSGRFWSMKKIISFWQTYEELILNKKHILELFKLFKMSDTYLIDFGNKPNDIPLYSMEDFINELPMQSKISDDELVKLRQNAHTDNAAKKKLEELGLRGKFENKFQTASKNSGHSVAQLRNLEKTSESVRK